MKILTKLFTFLTTLLIVTLAITPVAHAAQACGESCGGSLGLCNTGFVCTYSADTTCGSTTGICVPVGTETGDRGPIPGVTYLGQQFERRQCTTQDTSNNFLYHPSNPTKEWTESEVTSLICDVLTQTTNNNTNNNTNNQLPETSRQVISSSFAIVIIGFVSVLLGISLKNSPKKGIAS